MDDLDLDTRTENLLASLGIYHPHISDYADYDEYLEEHRKYLRKYDFIWMELYADKPITEEKINRIFEYD